MIFNNLFKNFIQGKKIYQKTLFFSQTVYGLPNSVAFVLSSIFLFSFCALPSDYYVTELWDTLLRWPLWKVKVFWLLYFVLHCKLSLKLCFLKMPMSRVLEMQVFGDMRSVMLSWHLITLPDALRYVERTTHGMANVTALSQQWLAYFKLPHGRAAGTHTEISSFWCHNHIAFKMVMFPNIFSPSTSTYQIDFI